MGFFFDRKTDITIDNCRLLDFVIEKLKNIVLWTVYAGTVDRWKVYDDSINS